MSIASKLDSRLRRNDGAILNLALQDWPFFMQSPWPRSGQKLLRASANQ
jgi:hypothetical protein